MVICPLKLEYLGLGTLVEVGLAPLNITSKDLLGNPTGKNSIVDSEEQICEELLHLILRLYNLVG